MQELVTWHLQGPPGWHRSAGAHAMSLAATGATASQLVITMPYSQKSPPQLITRTSSTMAPANPTNASAILLESNNSAIQLLDTLSCTKDVGRAVTQHFVNNSVGLLFTWVIKAGACVPPHARPIPPCPRLRGLLSELSSAVEQLERACMRLWHGGGPWLTGGGGAVLMSGATPAPCLLRALPRS